MLNDHEMGFEEKGLVDKDGNWNGEVGHSGSMLGKVNVEVGLSGVYQFDELGANGKDTSIEAELSTSVGYGYEVGDMVWGKVKSHPCWPGFIYNEAFASSSVRRMKRSGYVLVAFFGDSSYGWFDPAELIPFDVNFFKKSRQMNSRNFVKAVEEAVDEASRRSGLGLTCRCRNPYNFRPTDVQNYFAVDVGDYEPGVVYSIAQIRDARDKFHPIQTLAFMKQLALMPRSDGSINFIKNKATVLAYRKAVFEEFDETYAQAFGAQPVRPSREPMEAGAQPVRAPLSGPLVIAEASSKRKNSTKSNKVKDQANKDKYLFKQRDMRSEIKIQQIGQATYCMQPAYVKGSTELLVSGDYVLQKRDPAVSTKQRIPAKVEQTGTVIMDGSSVLSPDTTSAEVITTEDKSSVTRFNLVSSPAIADPTIMDGSGLSGKGIFCGGIDVELYTSVQGGEAATNWKHEGQRATAPKMVEGFQQPQSVPAMVGQEQVFSDGSAGHVLITFDAKIPGQDLRVPVDTGTKKAKRLKHPVGELGVENAALVEKKKRKKRLDMEMSSDRMQKRAATGKGGASGGRLTGKSAQVGLPPREDYRTEHQKKDNRANRSLLADSLVTQLTVGRGNIALKLGQLLGDLQDLALNPFHGVERNSPAIIREAFLKFRSVVYQKSLALSTSADEMESNNVCAPKSAASTSPGSDNLPRENIKDLPSLKPPKPLVRPDDPTKGGRKRGPSDRQEDSTAKRLKKNNDMKSPAVDKKAAQKTGAQRDRKETVALRPPKPLKPDSVKKTESPAKAPEPTMLVMKFPPKTSLPSGSELKARLARFGPLDHSSTRIFWQTSTCRVVFIHRAHAEAAYKHITGNNILFGNVNVRCHIRPLGEAAPESESLQVRDSAVEQRPPAAATATATATPAQQPVVQLKSCLKKPMGDEGGSATGGNGGGRGTTRVKFVLAREESSVGEQLMVGNKNFNNASFAEGAASSCYTSSHGLDFDSKSFQKVIIPPHPLPILPNPPFSAQFSNAAPINIRYAEVAFRNTHNFNINMAPPVMPSPTRIDIAPQMLSLLLKCNDVVTHVRSFMGYVPYHPI